MTEIQIKNLIKEYEKEYIEFMEIEKLPQYKIDFFEINVEESDAAGFASAAQAHYNTKTDFWKLSTVDEYTAESCFFIDEQFDVKIKNELLAKAIETLTERKKEVIFLSYFQGMSDAAIARKLNLVRSTVCEHRTRSLEMLKNTMEEYGYENYR